MEKPRLQWERLAWDEAMKCYWAKMLAARPTCLPLRLVITALRPSAACLLGLACIDGGGSAGMARPRFSWDGSQAWAGQGSRGGQVWAGAGCHPARRGPAPRSSAVAGWEPWWAPCPVIGGLQMAGVPWNLLSKQAFLRVLHCLTLLYQKAGNG